MIALIRFGADPYIRNVDEEDVFDYAKKYNRRELSRVVANYKHVSGDMKIDEFFRKWQEFIFDENKYFIASYSFLNLYSTNDKEFYKNNQMIYGDNEFVTPELFKLGLEGDILSDGYCKRYRYVEINRYYKMNKNVYVQVGIKPKFYYTMSLDIDISRHRTHQQISSPTLSLKNVSKTCESWISDRDQLV